jgi:hypothetical protein
MTVMPVVVVACDFPPPLDLIRRLVPSFGSASPADAAAAVANGGATTAATTAPVDALSSVPWHGLFLYLATSFQRRDDRIVDQSYVGAGWNLQRRMLQLGGELAKGPKATRDAHGPWTLQMVIGPIFRHSRELRRLWRRRSRSLKSRIGFGIGIAAATQKPIYIRTAAHAGPISTTPLSTSPAAMDVIE